MPKHDLTPRQMQRILTDQAHKAVSAAFRLLEQKNENPKVIESALKDELRRILNGEIIYPI